WLSDRLTGGVGNRLRFYLEGTLTWRVKCVATVDRVGSIDDDAEDPVTVIGKAARFGIDEPDNVAGPHGRCDLSRATDSPVIPVIIGCSCFREVRNPMIRARVTTDTVLHVVFELVSDTR